MTDPNRVLPPLMEMSTHDQGMKDCAVMTSTAIHTVEMVGGRAYAAMVFNQPGCPIGAVIFLDRAEGEAQIALLNNALDDADRINNGLRPFARRDPGMLQ